MSIKPLSDETIKHTVDVYRRSGFNVSATAKELGIERRPVRNRLAKAKERGLLPDEVVIHKPNDKATSLAVVAKQKKAFAKRKRKGSWRKPHRIDFDYTGPYMLIAFGDQHFDDDGTDLDLYEYWEGHLDSANRVYGLHTGDFLNNWLRFLGFLWGEQETRPPEAWELFKHYLPRFAPHSLAAVLGNHDCLDADTEVLTRDGWKCRDALKETDEVFGLDDQGNGRWQPIIGFVDKPAQRRTMHYYDASRCNMLVTPGHRVIHQRRNHDYSWSPLQYQQAKDLGKGRIRIPIAAEESAPSCGLDADLLWLMGFLAADGSRDAAGVWSIYQSKPAPQLEACLARLGIEPSIYVRERKIKEVVGRELVAPPKPQRQYYLGAEVSRWISQHCPDKNVPEILQQATSQEFDVWLQGLIAGDGTRHSNGKGWSVYGRREFLDEVQALAVRRGWAANLRIDTRGHSALSLCRNVFYQTESGAGVEVEHDGPVWCLQVPLTNFMARREGKPFFTGNCWNEASHFFKELFEPYPMHVQPDAIRLEIRQPNTKPVTVSIRHRWKGHSQWNPAHAIMKAARFGHRDDILIGGDYHISGEGKVVCPDTKRVTHCHQIASFKLIDRYADQLGLEDMHINPAQAFVVRPWFDQSDPRRVCRFDDPADARAFLDAERDRYESRNQ